MLDRGSAMRDGFGCCFGVGLLMVAGAAFGQTAAGNPGQAAAGKLAFVSATVKPSAPVTIDSAHAASAQFEADVKAGKVKLQPGVMVNTTHPRMGAHVDASQAEYNFLPLIDLIAIAYNVKVNHVSGPDWINGQRFDIVAKMPGGAFIADASNMLQALLEDRFKLAVHRENKNQQVLALMVASGGPKLQPATASLPPITGNIPCNPLNRTLDTPDGQVRISTNGHKGETLVSNKMTMAGLADLLTNLFQGGGGVSPGGGGGGQWQKVVDQTELTGEYQVTFNSSMPLMVGRIMGTPASTGGGVISNDMLQMLAAEEEQRNPSYTAFSGVTNQLDLVVIQSIQQKLGLNLEPSKAPVEMLVVDHAEKNPTAN